MVIPKQEFRKRKRRTQESKQNKKKNNNYLAGNNNSSFIIKRDFNFIKIFRRWLFRSTPEPIHIPHLLDTTSFEQNLPHLIAYSDEINIRHHVVWIDLTDFFFLLFLVLIAKQFEFSFIKKGKSKEIFQEDWSHRPVKLIHKSSRKNDIISSWRLLHRL